MEQSRQTEQLTKQQTDGTDQSGQEVRERSFPMNGLRICVDRYDGDLEGRIYSKMSRDELYFGNMSELLLRADALFDERGYPQNFQEKRSFAENTAWDGRYKAPEVLRKDEDVLNQKGQYCTFDVLVSSRRRASWQGALMDQGRPQKSFQSAKELLELILGALKRRETPGERQENEKEDK